MLYSCVLIGCGRISHKHIQALIDNKDRLRLAAVCDTASEKAGKARAEYTAAIEGSEVKVYSDYRKCLKR